MRTKRKRLSDIKIREEEDEAKKERRFKQIKKLEVEERLEVSLRGQRQRRREDESCCREKAASEPAEAQIPQGAAGRGIGNDSPCYAKKGRREEERKVAS